MSELLNVLKIVAVIAILGGGVITAVTFLNAARLPKPKKYEPNGAEQPDRDFSVRAAKNLSELIKYQTVSVRTGEDYSNFTRLADYLRRHYPQTHRTMTREIVGKHSLLYHWKAQGEASGEPILFCAHMDVVPAEGSWDHDPFSGDIYAGSVWGRGAIDCKNIVCCLMEAAESLVIEGFSPKRDVYFAFGHDEELGGPDGAYRIAALLHERRISFHMVLDEGMPLARGILGVRKPTARVAVTEKGAMNIKITAFGKSGHSSTPPRHSAIGVLADAISLVEFSQMPPKMTPVVREFFKRMAPHTHGGMRYRLANLPLFGKSVIKALSRKAEYNALFRTTVASTVVGGGIAHNILPESAKAIFNARLIHGDACRDMTAYVKSVTRNLDVSVETLLMNEASRVSDYSGAAFTSLEAAIHETFGDVVVTPYVMSMATDARKYEQLSGAVFRFSPFELTNDEAETMHSVNEHIRIELLGKAISFYKKLITDI